MTEEEKKIEDEITESVSKLCAGRVLCKECEHKSRMTEYVEGCWGKEAIRFIIEARKERDEWKAKAEKAMEMNEQNERLKDILLSSYDREGE